MKSKAVTKKPAEKKPVAKKAKSTKSDFEILNKVHNTRVSRKRVVVITGGSQGIGFATARNFALHYDVVYNLSRTKQPDDRIKFIKTDLTKPEEITAAFRKIFKDEGQIDILINNAGMGISGSSENTKAEDIERIISINFIGLALCCSAVIPYMREQSERGTIINISSLAAQYPLHFQSFYSASKAAVTNYTLALRNEVRPFEIRVCSVLLGDINTQFTDNRKKNEYDDKSYKHHMARAIAKYEYDETTKGARPDAIASKLYKLSYKSNPKPTVIFGFGNKMLVFFSRFVSTRFINWVISKKY
jgi:short-subunit dehydrogenase